MDKEVNCMSYHALSCCEGITLECLGKILESHEKDILKLRGIMDLVVTDEKLSVRFRLEKLASMRTSYRESLKFYLKKEPVRGAIQEKLLHPGEILEELEDDKIIVVLPVLEKGVAQGALILLGHGMDSTRQKEDLAFLLKVFFRKMLDDYFYQIVPVESMQKGKLTSICDYEKYAIISTGNRMDWNISKMAETLRIGRSTLYNKMKRYGLY